MLGMLEIGMLALGAACRPDLETTGALVDRPRILAVAAEPPEGAPGTTVQYRALIAAPPGATLPAVLDWSFCSAPKPLTENDIVTAACLDPSSPARASFARDATTTAAGATPGDACQSFGPDPPPGMFRARDPDVTGGYYQPVVVEGTPEPAIALERLVCNLARAPVDVARDFAQRYVPNRNPAIATIELRAGGAAIDAHRVPAGAAVTVEVTWTPASREAYLLYDLPTQTLVPRFEALDVAWFASAGAVDPVRSGRAEEDATARAATIWTAPRGAGQAVFWVVLRDSRGGIDFRAVELEVGAP